jgi:cell division protein DivIC
MGAEQTKSVSKIQTTYVKQQEYAEIVSARKKKLLARRLAMFLVLASILSYLMISSSISQTAKLKIKMAQKKELDHKLTELTAQQDILNENIIKLNDDDYIAKLARKEYFFSEKNEIIFNIPDEKEGK